MRAFSSDSLVKAPHDRVRDLGDCKVLQVETRRPIAYTVVNVSRPAFNPLSPYIKSFVSDRQTFAVIDQRLMWLYGSSIIKYLCTHTNFAGHMYMPVYETTKTLRTVRRILASAVEHRLDRSAVILAIGGGVVMDVVGLTASLYRRGIDYLKVPTTLVGLVDVAVGIKTAVNANSKKNVLGSFHPPLGAIGDRRFLRTLKRRHLACGLAEILKMGLVKDPVLFELSERFAEPLMSTGFSEPDEAAEEIVLRAQATMIDELEPNLFEEDKRRLVDFGHTVSPILEAATGYRMHHGEAVAVDMLFSAALGAVKGLSDGCVFDRMRALYQRIGLPVRSERLTDALVSHSFDEARKHRDGSLNLVVPTGVGRAMFVQEVSSTELTRALALMR